MPITFEEVTADIEREPQERGAGPQAPAADAAPDIGEQIEQALRLKAERAARLCDL
ncbi:hypothetical protein ACFJIX_16850 [Roseateles sp. UC29_93]|uniref:hypothetical protein n=1 Tax=Roseateles sp. UC29_93 TaxID=3350177 RepID=UPI00030F502F